MIWNSTNFAMIATATIVVAAFQIAPSTIAAQTFDTPAENIMIGERKLDSVLGDIAFLRGALNASRGKGNKPLDPPQGLKQLIDTIDMEQSQGPGLAALNGLGGALGRAFLTGAKQTVNPQTGEFDATKTVKMVVSGKITNLEYKQTPKRVILEVETKITYIPAASCLAARRGLLFGPYH